MSLLGERLTGDGEAAVFAAEAENSEGARGHLVKKQPWSIEPTERSRQGGA